MTAWEAIQRECKRTGWPRHFKSDLDQDFKVLVEHKPKEFGWSLRETGTDIFLPMDTPLDGHWTWCGARTVREWSYEWAKAAGKYKERRFYWWDGQRLMPITVEKLLHKIAHTGKEDADAPQVGQPAGVAV